MLLYIGVLEVYSWQLHTDCRDMTTGALSYNIIFGPIRARWVAMGLATWHWNTNTLGGEGSCETGLLQCFSKGEFFEYLGRNPPFVSAWGQLWTLNSPLVRGDPATTPVWAGPAAQQREWTETDDSFHRWYGTGFFHKQNIQYTA